MAIIKLTRGYETVVDDDMFEQLSKSSWYAQGPYGNIRPARRLRKNEGSYKALIYMYHEILGIMPWLLEGKQVDHIDGNPLNNRRDNLRIVSRFGNMQNTSRTRNPLRGVGRDRTHGTWKAYKDILASERPKRRINVGTYTTKAEAQEARLFKMLELGIEA